MTNKRHKEKTNKQNDTVLKRWNLTFFAAEKNILCIMDNITELIVNNSQ